MMENTLILKGDRQTPSINFNYLPGQFKLSGRSLPENSVECYGPVIDWLQNYLFSTIDPILLEIKLDYFNSGSLKQLYKLFLLIENFSKSGNEGSIIWKYAKTDVLMEQKGREFKQFLDLPFTLVEI
ncbi:DUF1987 domain-containing protein [Crocinitomix catalasitica]|uniref:DUF1987 domain-containing protein n=1 Tax=Crocinitomix catalasitica TaxID=184607 RepID=UPI0006844E25|nr:DUF1987 domain-containing protein [Crocinitomix catalasitica]